MEIKLNDAKCTQLSISSPVSLAKEDGKKGEFIIEAYTGAIVERWWGKLAIDIDGITAPQKMPNFFNHDHDKIVGFSTKSWKDGSFYVSGKFSQSTEAAKEVQGLADEEFPWQASIGVKALKVLYIEDGATHLVNGEQLEGPAEVWIESEVFEVSFVPFGADGNTSVQTFSKFSEKPAPTGAKHKPEEGEIMEFTLEALQEKAPDLLKQIQADARKEALREGAENELARIQAVLEHSMPGHEDLIESLAFDGKTTGPEAAVQVLAAEKQLLAKKKEDLNDDSVPPVSQPAAPDPKPKTDPTTEDEFKKDSDLVEEFGDWETYKAYLDATGKGLVKTLKKEGK